MVNYNIKFNLNDTFRWPDCKYCDREGMPSWSEGNGSIEWICPYHRRMQREGWLDLVLLVRESISG